MRGLQKRGQQVVPLKYRRETPLKPIPVEALCDFEGDQVSSAHVPPEPQAGRAQICPFACHREVFRVTWLDVGPHTSSGACARPRRWGRSLPAATPSRPGLLVPLSKPSHSLGSPGEGPHWPTLNHVSSLNQSWWPGGG